MARGIRHPRSTRVGDRSASQRGPSNGAGTSDEASQRIRGVASSQDSQRNRDVAPSQEEPAIKRGRKVGAVTKLAIPLLAAKVALEPKGDLQFSYVNFKPPYKYTTQLGVILKREYPGPVEDKDQNGVALRKRAAVQWADYFLEENDLGETSGDRVLSEFWRLFMVRVEDQEEADRVLENYLRKRVRDMIHQARVDAVKVYYHKMQNQTLDDALARPIELDYEQYMHGQLEWCKDEVWPYLCSYWCSDDFKLKRKRGQECRLRAEEIAQNHGGSRPFTETQQVLKAKFGPDKATQLNTYAVMKSGMKSVDGSGCVGAIKSRKAQKRMDDYLAGVRRVTHPEGQDEEHEDLEEEQQEQEQVLNEQVLYELSGGTPHGRVLIANGAIRAADVRAAAKEKHVRPSNPVTLQNMAREMSHLRRENARLRQESSDNAMRLERNQVTTDLLLELYRDLGKEIPAAALQRLSASQQNGTGSSRIGSESTNNDIADYARGENLHDEQLDNNDGSNNSPRGNHVSQ